MAIYIDSDVLISSILSSTGAAHQIIFKLQTDKYICNLQVPELENTARKVSITPTKLKSTINSQLKIVDLGTNPTPIKNTYKPYTPDINDTHIIAGAAKSKAKYLTTFNLKHFPPEKIQQQLKITALTPGQLLHLFRSQS